MICVMLTLAVQTVWGQQRYSCTHSEATTRGRTYSLPDPMVFDRSKVYRQPVVLISFEDTDFSMADPERYYDRLFNEKGYNEGAGPGCVADYFRDQSDGLLNLQFDIYGPYKVDFASGGHYTHYTGEEILRAACKQMYASEETDFHIYDWDSDNLVNQVVYVAAGLTGNQVNDHIWPNTVARSYKLPGDVYSEMGSVTCELWKDSTSCGIGIIIHEFAHCLGLPDVYPLTPATIFSAVDEWDLMDGGDYTGKGWCPPNLTAMEKLFLGWKQPKELTSATTVTGMKSASKGGEIYLVRNSGNNNEYYLLENRQQEGWDYGCPGNGLLISHVDYNRESWSNNQVNISNTYYRYDLFHADGKDYLDWDPANSGLDPNKYTQDNWMRNRYLSTSTYPYTDPTTQVMNDVLNDSSSPASVVFKANAEGNLFMSKPISNIRMDSDGNISFDFMKGETAIDGVPSLDNDAGLWYDLQGRRLSGKPSQKGVYIHHNKKIAIR